MTDLRLIRALIGGDMLEQMNTQLASRKHGLTPSPDNVAAVFANYAVNAMLLGG